MKITIISCIVALTAFLMISATMVKTHANAKKVCKNQSTYMVDGTTYS